MTRKSSSHSDGHRHHHHGSHEKRSSSRPTRSSSSSRDLGPERYASPSRSNSERRISVEREGSVRSKGHSIRSGSRSTSATHNDASTFSYGPKQKRLVVVDSTDSDSEEYEISNEQSGANTGKRHWTYFFGIGAFILGVIIAIVTTYSLMSGNSDSKQPNQIVDSSDTSPLAEVVPTMDPTFSPTGMPTVEYPPPELAVCEALSTGRDVRTSTSGTLLARNMDMTFDITLGPGGPFKNEQELFDSFPKQVESALIPILAGCDDVQGFRRKLNSKEQGSLQRRELDELEQIRYVIAGGAVTGNKLNEIECPPSTSGQLLSCFNVVVYFEFLLKGDERSWQVMSLITSILNKLSSQGKIVGSNGIVTPSLVNSLGFPDPPFQNVVVTGIKNNDPTVSPSVNPTQFPTDRPSTSPSHTPTGAPSIAPSGAPSKEPTPSPSATPTMAPTKGPTKSPTPQPTQAPTLKPSAYPTGQPSSAPSAFPSAKPSMSPSTVPSISNAPSLSSAPSSVPSISNAPTSRMGFIIGMLPSTHNNMTGIDWLSYTDTWMPLLGDGEDALWADRYALYLSFGDLAGFAQIGNSHCGWTGITCDANGRVTKVELASKGLTNGIPSELSYLSELTSLNLTENDFTGTTIPTEMFTLSKLEYLDISNSGINGTIPTQILNLVALRDLHINSNNLVGTIPALPELVRRSPDDVITLGSGIEVASVCEMYGNSLVVNTVSTANAGGCDLVRTASDSSSSSSSSSSDDTGSTSSAPVTRMRYRSLFERGNQALDDESSSDDEDELRNKFRSPVYDAISVRAPKATKRIKHMLVKKHTKRGKKYNMANRNLDAMDADEFQRVFSDFEE